MVGAVKQLSVASRIFQILIADGGGLRICDRLWFGSMRNGESQMLCMPC